MKTHLPYLNLFVLFLFFSFGIINGMAQTIIDPYSDPGYEILKSSQASSKSMTINETNSEVTKEKPITNSKKILPNTTKSSANSPCFIEPDGLYSTFGGNDDSSLGSISLGFNFDLYGTTYNQIYINNNGNITFTSGTYQYTASGFPFSNAMVAPFWADVDTRSGNTVKYKSNPTNFIVTWEDVGYYNTQTDKLNTFQLIITNGTDPIIGYGYNVAFFYGEMEWTTGSASQGVNGFLGSPATVGINKGDNVNYVQIGRFNQNSSVYDGSGGNNDGINYLDNKCFYFNVSSATNQPPSVSGLPFGNSIDIECGNTETISLGFLGPEVFQTVSTVVNTGVLCNTSVVINNGTVATADVTIDAAPCNLGTHIITFVATDNHATPASTTVNITVNILDSQVPTIVCPPTITTNNDPGQCGANVFFTVLSSDNCGIPTLTYDYNPGDYFSCGTTLVTATATDDFGNSSTCSFDIIVIDVEVPNISCPFDITVENDQGVCEAIVNYTLPSATDNCGTGPLPTSIPGFTFKGIHEGHSYFISNYQTTPEAAHAAAIATGGHLVTIHDYAENLLVSFFHPGRIWIGFTDRDNEGVWEWVTSEPVAYTNWGPTEPNNYNGIEDWAVINWFGQNTNWNDWYYTSGAFFAIEFDGGTIPVQLLSGPASGDPFPVGITPVTYEVVDATGNSAMCIFDVTVIDEEDPVIICPDFLTVQNDPGLCGAVVTYTIPIGTDNCPGATTDLISGLGSGGFYDVGTHSNTYEVTDAVGLFASCSFNITVIDAELPVIVCPDNLTIQNDIGDCGAIVNYTLPDGTDNCPGALTELIAGLGSGAFYSVGVHTNEYMVTDAVGLTASCISSITIIDVEPPEIDCIASTERCEDALNLMGTNNYTAIGEEFDLISESDNCEIQSITYTLSGSTVGSSTTLWPIDNTLNGIAFGIGITNVEWLVTDIYGNFTICSFEVEIHALPVITISSSDADEWCNGVTITCESTSQNLIYDWSNSATTQSLFLSIATHPAGLYSVTVTDQYGCVSAAPAVYNYVPEDLSSSYTIIGFQEAQIGMNNFVQSGSVGLFGVDNMAHVKKNSEVNGDGSFVKADYINIHQTATVLNLIYDPATIALPTMYFNTSTGISGTINVPSNSTTTITDTHKNIKINNSSIVTIVGDVYGFIDIGSNCVVNFVNSSLDIDRIKIKKSDNANNVTTINFSGNTDIRIKQKLEIDEFCIFNPDNYKVVCYIGDGVTFDGHFQMNAKGNTFNGCVYVPFGQILVHKSAHYSNPGLLTGFFIANTVHANGKYVYWNWRNCGPANNSSIAESGQFDENENQLDDLKLNVYPNPFVNQITIEFESTIYEKVKIEIFNILGEKVLTVFEDYAIANQINRLNIDCNNIGTGIYQVRATINGKNITKRVIRVE